MKRMSFIVLLSLFSVCAIMAQTEKGLVRIKLQTTAGADISIDGDLSSTNIMYTKVTTGKHQVTVKYEDLYEKTYTIDISENGEKEFSFPVEGEVIISSVPNANIYVDGIPHGQTPQTIKIIGSHNIKLQSHKGDYYTINEQVVVKPFESKKFSYTLRKLPPRLNIMTLANYSFCKGFGGTVAVCRNWGGYLHAIVAGTTSAPSDQLPGRLTSSYYDDGWSIDHEVFYKPSYYKSDSYYKLFTAGVMKRLNKNIFAYVGAGYGDFAQDYQDIYGHECTLSSAEGVAGDIGVIISIKNVLLQFGYASILTGKTGDMKWHHDPYIGIGFNFGKNKKQN